MTLTTESKLVQCSSTALHVWQQEFNSNHHVRLFFLDFVLFSVRFGWWSIQHIFLCVFCLVIVLFGYCLDDSQWNIFMLSLFGYFLVLFCFQFGLEDRWWNIFLVLLLSDPQSVWLCTGLTCHSIACKCHTGFYQK